MKRIRGLYFVAFLFLLACDASTPKQDNQESIEHTIRGKAQGTTYTIKYLGEKKQPLSAEIDSLLKAIDTSMSTWVSASVISKFNRGDSIEIDSMFLNVFLESKKLNHISNGSFDPSIGPLIEAWGFDYIDSKKMDSAKVDSLLSFCGFEQFTLNKMVLKKKDRRAKLNFNAIAQGYSVDLMADLMERYGVQDYFVELGGEVKVKGKNSRGELWRIGIDKPEGQNLERKLSSIVKLGNEAMVTSGNYRKYLEIDGEKYSHSLNPQTGYPVRHNLLSATIITEKASTADALATACMVKGLKGARKLVAKQDKVEAILIYSDSTGNLKTFISEGIKNKVENLEED